MRTFIAGVVMVRTVCGPYELAARGGFTTEITAGHGEKEKIHDSTVFDPEAQTRRELAEVRGDAKSAEKRSN